MTPPMKGVTPESWKKSVIIGFISEGCSLQF